MKKMLIAIVAAAVTLAGCAGMSNQGKGTAIGAAAGALVGGLVSNNIGAVLLGDLNAVAALVTMFFLTVYGTVNIVATFEVLSGDPSWRPKIKVPWPITLIGGLACVVVMVLISPVAGLIALVAEFSLWMYLSRRVQKARFGDARRGLYEALIRWALIRLNERPMSARNWRPHLLTFVDDPLKELDLIRFSDWFSQGRGVVTVCNLVVGDLMSDDLDIDDRRQRIQSVIDAEDIVRWKFSPPRCHSNPEVVMSPVSLPGLIAHRLPGASPCSGSCPTPM